GRLHCSVDERVAGRGVYPGPVDGRPGRPAVSRIHHDDHDRDRDFARGVTDDDADDVRHLAARRSPPTAWAHLPDQRIRLRGDVALLSLDAWDSITPPAAGDVDTGRDALPELPSLPRGPEGLCAAAGFRSFAGGDPGRSTFLVSTDATEAHAIHRHRQTGPGGRHRARLHRRRRAGLRRRQYRNGIRLTETDQRARGLGRAGGRTATRAALGCGRRHFDTESARGPRRRRAYGQRGLSIPPARLDVRRTERMDAE